MSDDIPKAPLLKDALLLQEDDKSEMDKIFELILNPQNIKHLTSLTKNEITAFSVLATIANRHKLSIVQEFLAENLILRVSEKRLGRKESIKIASRQLMQTDQIPGLDGERSGWRRWLKR